MNLLKLALLFVTFPMIASAHAGHLTDLAGHDHVVAGVAIGVAIAIGIAKAAKGRNAKDNETESDGEPEESEGEPA